jgi:hypothetical protein
VHLAEGGLSREVVDEVGHIHLAQELQVGDWEEEVQGSDFELVWRLHMTNRVGQLIRTCKSDNGNWVCVVQVACA